MAGNDTYTVTINLYDAATKKPLHWSGSASEDPKSRKKDTGAVTIESGSFKVLGHCGDPDPCPKTFQGDPNSAASFSAPIRRNADTRIYAETVSAGNIKRSGILLLRHSCDDLPPQHFYLSKEADQKTDDTVSVVVEAARCPGDTGEGRPQNVRIKEAWATVVTTVTGAAGAAPATTSKETPISATVIDGIAYFKLRPTQTVNIDATFEEERIQAMDSLPYQYTPGNSGGLIKLLCQDAQLWVALLFYNCKGEPQTPIISVEGAGIYAPTTVNEHGVCVIRPSRFGRMRVTSSNCEIFPQDFEVDEFPMAQVKLFEVRSKRQDLWGEEEEIFLDFAHALAAEDRALVRILTIEGKLIDILRAESGKPLSFTPPADQAIVIEAECNGTVVDRIVHRPKELAIPADKS